jgi:hypothetical protein
MSRRSGHRFADKDMRKVKERMSLLLIEHAACSPSPLLLSSPSPRIRTRACPSSALLMRKSGRPDLRGEREKKKEEAERERKRAERG